MTLFYENKFFVQALSAFTRYFCLRRKTHRIPLPKAFKVKWMVPYMYSVTHRNTIIGWPFKERFYFINKHTVNTDLLILLYLQYESPAAIPPNMKVVDPILMRSIF